MPICKAFLKNVLKYLCPISIVKGSKHRKPWEKYLIELKDRPLDASTSQLLVNRNEELVEIPRLVRYYEGGIIGIAGERGIGKTTLFNLLRFPGKEKLIINVVDRESPSSILLDILSELKEYAGKKGLNYIADTLKELIASLTITLNPHISVKVREKGKSFREVVKSLESLLSEMAEESPLVVILDEIDKEKKEDILRIIDAIKSAFKNNDVTLLVALPYTIYEEFSEAKATAKETYNLENVFDTIFPINPLADSHIKELLLKRIPKKYIEEEALNLIVLYARGNPRRAITTLKEVGFISRGDKIRRKDVEAVIRFYIKQLSKALDERELKALLLVEGGEKRSVVVRKWMKNLNLSKPTAYRLWERLRKLSLLKGEKTAFLSPEARLIKHFLPKS